MKKIFVIICFLSIPFFSFAQEATTTDASTLLSQSTGGELDFLKDLIDKNTGLPNGITEQISVAVVPTYPKPNQPVAVRVTTSSTNLDKAYFIWYLDGKETQRGYGLSSFSLLAGSIKNQQRVTVNIRKNEGGIFEKTITIKPTEVDMFYEAFTYTPPFYRGLPLFSYQSTAVIYATPRGYNANGLLIPFDQYTYTWSVNGKVDQSKSGYGINYFIYPDSIFSETARISVKVSSRDNSVSSVGTINLMPTSPSVVLYEDNPIYGVIYENAVTGTKKLDREEITISAVPFFFDKRLGHLNFNWRANGSLIKQESQSSITFRQDADVNGTADVSVEVKNKDKILQNSVSNFFLVFGEEAKRIFNF